MRVRSSLEWFAEQMEATLRQNDHKSGYESMTTRGLHTRLMQESRELSREIDAINLHVAGGGTVTYIQRLRIIKESTDVANFALFIADNAHGERI